METSKESMPSPPCQIANLKQENILTKVGVQSWLTLCAYAGVEWNEMRASTSSNLVTGYNMTNDGDCLMGVVLPCTLRKLELDPLDYMLMVV